MPEIINVRDYSGGLEAAARFFHAAWSGIDYRFYRDAIEHSSLDGSSLPRFYLLLKDGSPIGCVALRCCNSCLMFDSSLLPRASKSKTAATNHSARGTTT